MIHTFDHPLCKGKRPTDQGWIWQVGECSQQPVSKRKKWAETKAISSRKDIFVESTLILPNPRKVCGLSHKVYRCGRRKSGNQGWQTSSGRPGLGEQCCSGHTWRNKSSTELNNVYLLVACSEFMGESMFFCLLVYFFFLSNYRKNITGINVLLK